MTPIPPAGEQAPTTQELIARASALVPLLRSNITATEKLGNPAPENLAALRDAGLFRLTTPPDHGGLHPSMRTQVQIISEVGRGCASTGWIVANHAASTEFTLILPDEATQEIFGDNPDAIFLSAGCAPDARAERVPGGLRVSARAPYASGCEISDWALLIGIPLYEGGQVKGAVNVLVALGEAKVERTWNVAGMSGTGTNAMTVTDVFVPERRTLVVEKDNLDRLEELLSPTELVKGNLHSLSSLVGGARGALDLVRETLARDKPIAYSTYRRAADSPAVQQAFTEATHLIDTASLHMLHVADEFDALPPHTELSRVARARARMHSASALARAREGMQKLLDIAGTSGFAHANALQVYWRDLEVGSRHAMLGLPMILEDYGRALLDVGPTITQYH
ncbi:acyl-CoA dehydrogenase family protein [Streptomyces capitiformicae]|uniref:Acyl-CoA dehydrogenase n=1 Tax=Streptomyces capitiformicae TaxID=2014920 RepID=A0A918ZLB0_9ACTN|nr:acyl-CoA dehydrogenase family protein [Streptomyces capitiformicae]GHE57482.1 acyl-CoA dehydrogenase [Streptomyces capitiformicae]